MTQTPMQYGAPLSLEAAKSVMEAAEGEAVKEGWSLVIAIVDSGCHLVMLHRMNHAQLGSIMMAQQKAETAVRFKRPTKAFQTLLDEGTAHLRTLAMPNGLPLEGGIPLVVDGKIVGGIGVSGVRSAQDTQVALAGSAALADWSLAERAVEAIA